MSIQEEIDNRPLQDMSLDAMVSWLEKGLRGYLLGNDGAWVFGSTSIYIGRTEHLVLDFREMFLALPADRTRVRFREAVATLLGRLPEEPDSVVLFEHLLSIAAVVESYETLGVIRQRVGGGFFGLTDNLDGHSLFAQTLDFVAGLAKAPDQPVLETLDALIDSPYFEPAYANLALLAYCRADDKSLPKHLDRLRPYFTAIQADRELWSTQAAQNIAWQVSDTIGWAEIARILPQLRYIPDEPDVASNTCAALTIDNPLYFSTDFWLVYGLLKGMDPPAGLSWTTEGDLLLVSTENEEKRYPIDQGIRFNDMLDCFRRGGFFTRELSSESPPGQKEDATNSPASILIDASSGTGSCIPLTPETPVAGHG